MDRIYYDFKQYPVDSKESPFDKDSKGKYFAWLTNRKDAFSYLSENKDDFQYYNGELYKAMPMGYTNLWILERIALEVGGELVASYGEAKQEMRCFYVILDGNGKYEQISEYEYIELCQDKKLSDRVVKLIANLLNDYYWH